MKTPLRNGAAFFVFGPDWLYLFLAQRLRVLVAEVVLMPFRSAGRGSAKPAVNAFVAPRSFGCGCAMLLRVFVLACAVMRSRLSLVAT